VDVSFEEKELEKRFGEEYIKQAGKQAKLGGGARQG
jgi:hypothetical protein